MWARLPLAAGLASLTALASAEASSEWHTTLVGTPSVDTPSALPPLNRFYSISTSTAGKRKSIALSLTDKNILAAQDPATGNILWRRQYKPNERPIAYYPCGDTITVISSTGTHSLSGKTGATRWVQESEGAAQGGVDAICLDPTAADVVTLLNGDVRSVAGATGKVTWEWKANSGSSPLRLSQLSPFQLSVILSSDSTLFSVPLSLSTGVPLSTLTMKSSPKIDSQFIAVLPAKAEGAPPTLIWLNAGALKSSLHGVDSFSGVKSFSEGEGGAFTEIVDVGLREKGVFVARREDGSATVFGAEGGVVKSLWNFHEPTDNGLYSGFVDRAGDEHVALLSFSSTLNLGNLKILSLRPTLASPTGLVTGHTFPFSPSLYGSFRTFCVEVSPQSEYVVATRAIIGTSSGAVQLWTGSKLGWIREEGLASVDVRPVFVPPPERAHLGDLKELHEGFEQRLERQAAEIQSHFSSRASRVAPPPGAHEELIVLASSSSRSIYALDAAKSGSLSWRASPPVPSSDSFKWLRLQVVDGSDLIATAEITPAGVEKNVVVTKAFHFDAFSGEFKSEQVYEGVASSAVGAARAVTTVQREAGRLVGRQVFKGRAETIWTFTPPASEELHLVVPQQMGAVASLGRVLGNRTTLLKYLNPHLAAVVTLSPPTSTAILYFLDTASGSVVHKLNLLDVDTESDVKVVLQDNWLLASYKVKGVPGGLTKVVSVELYQPEEEGDIIKSSLRSSAKELRVLSRSFASPIELNVMGVTKTQLGITNYNAIFTNGVGQVITIPRRALDPRRVFDKASKDDQEEMLMMYDAILPINAQWTASHSEELLGITNVVSAPGRRESESLVLAFGNDLFFTRLSPSKSFDVLSPDFNKSQLVITVSILSVALVVVRSMVKARRVKQKWYSE
ncbi:ER membrane protein complex subunit 1, partial [Phenoliferia sp. Uapishka_3]